MYKLIKNLFTQEPASICRLSDNAFIPFDPANTDYQKFKQDVADGVKIQDENGKNLTAAKTKTFMASLP